MGFEQRETFLIRFAVEYYGLELLRRKSDRICLSKLLDSVWRANHDVNYRALWLDCESILVLFEGHVPGEQFPDVYFSDWILLVFLCGLCWELELVSKSLIERSDDKSVLS